MSPASKTTATDTFNEIATVRIELLDTDPLIWRQVEVPTSITLKVLHEFMVRNRHRVARLPPLGVHDRQAEPMASPSRRTGAPTPRIDAAKVRLRDVLQAATGQTIGYLYDFGDDWAHRLIVTDIRPGRSRCVLSPLHRRRMGRAARLMRRHTGLLRHARRPGRSDAIRTTPRPSRNGSDDYDPKEIDELPLKIALERRRKSPQRRAGPPRPEQEKHRPHRDPPRNVNMRPAAADVS